MLMTPKTLTAAAMIATLPSFTSAESTAVSLSASLDDGSVSSVAVAAAFGDFAVASSVANADGTGAAAGATDDATATPSTSVTYNSDANAYETIVTFVAAEAEDTGPEVDCDAIIADLGSETPTGSYGEDELVACGLSETQF